MAQDHGSPRRNTTTVLRVTVLDMNDNPPVIDGGAYITTNISEVGSYLRDWPNGGLQDLFFS